MTKVLVTGANGFIGSNLVARLKSDPGFSVRGAVRACGFQYGANEYVAVGNLSATTDWRAALEGVDVVVHTAAKVHRGREFKKKLLDEYRDVNVVGTLRLAEEAARVGVRRFVYLSSAGVHGEDSGASFFCETDPPQPYNVYTASKYEAEQKLTALGQRTGLEIVIVRPPLVYGMNAPGNVARLIRLVKSGVPLPFSNVTSYRSFCSVANLAGFLYVCLKHPAATGEVFLVADDKVLSLQEIVTLLASELGRKQRFFSFYQPLLKLVCMICGRAEDYRRITGSFVLSTSKARSLLGWTPEGSFDETVGAMVQAFRE